jgi:hypothetical protein
MDTLKLPVQEAVYFLPGADQKAGQFLSTTAFFITK